MLFGRYLSLYKSIGLELKMKPINHIISGLEMQIMVEIIEQLDIDVNLLLEDNFNETLSYFWESVYLIEHETNKK